MTQRKTIAAKRQQPPRSRSITRSRSSSKPDLDWGGERIVVPPEVQVQRLLPGRGAKARPVQMDIRGFVPTKSSDVVQRWIRDRIERAIAADPWLKSAFPHPRQSSWFDSTAHLAADIVFDQIEYQGRGGAAWQLAEETLALGKGDCEDRAVLLANALIAAGISPYNVRVALGSVAVRRPSARLTHHAHAWVVYRDEDGKWTSLEPVPNRDAKHRRAELEYSPDYVFNGDHQWTFQDRHGLPARRRWNSLDPTFHGEVHKSIVEHAAEIAQLPDPLRTRIARTFTTLFGNVIDQPDLEFRSYDPRDHFDTGLIDESWRNELNRLRIFYSKPIGDSGGIANACWAAHGIADFYAHSTYAHFLEAELGTLTPYDPEAKKPALGCDYERDAVFSKAKLSYYAKWYKPADFNRLEAWKGKLISGRYSLSGDSKDWIESITNEPPSAVFPSQQAKNRAGALPHHNEIAVDEADPGKSNTIYPKGTYQRQFTLRYNLAVRHIASALKKHPGL